MTMREEVIAFPYSFYSQDGHQEIIRKLNQMGYQCVKVYPDQTYPVKGG